MWHIAPLESPVPPFEQEVAMSRKPLLVAAVLAAGASLVAVVPALADQVFHTSHAAVHSVSGAPLRSGFVNDMHSNGAVNSAREEYPLSGAHPSRSYQVELGRWPSQSCRGEPFLTRRTAYR